jgi:hypothetical protein
MLFCLRLLIPTRLFIDVPNTAKRVESQQAHCRLSGSELRRFGPLLLLRCPPRRLSPLPLLGRPSRCLGRLPRRFDPLLLRAPVTSRRRFNAGS